MILSIQYVLNSLTSLPTLLLPSLCIIFRAIVVSVSLYYFPSDFAFSAMSDEATHQERRATFFWISLARCALARHRRSASQAMINLLPGSYHWLDRPKTAASRISRLLSITSFTGRGGGAGHEATGQSFEADADATTPRNGCSVDSIDIF